MKDKFNYTAITKTLYGCPCCTLEWTDIKHDYCPNCEVKIEYENNTLNRDKVMERITKDPAFEGLPEYAKERLEPLISDALCSLSLPTLSEEEIDKMAWNYAQDQTDDRGNQIEIHDDYFEGFKACQELTKPKEE